MASLEDRLAELQAAVAAIPEGQRSPEPTLDILGLERDEGAWQEYFAYFLDPNRPHGLNHHFLAALFDRLETLDALEFRPTEFELASSEYIEVRTERGTDQGNIPDIIIYEEGSWYLCLELKVDSSEGGGERAQTVRYAEDPDIVPDSVDAYDEGGYLYIAPRSTRPSISPQFTDVAWEDLVNVIDAVFLESTSTVSTSTLTQLSEFKTTIETQLMTSIDDDTRRRKDLYFEYRDVIDAVEDAIDPFVDDVLQNDWASALETDHRPESATDFEWEYTAIGNSYGQIRTPDWQTAREEEPFLDIHFEHKPRSKEFKQGRLTFLLELEEPDKSTISRESGERYHEFRADLLDGLPGVLDASDSRGWNTIEVDPGSSLKKLTRALYSYDPGDESGYYNALSQALDDHREVSRFVSETLQENDYSTYPR